MKIAIICRPENRSPKVLAYSLGKMFDTLGVEFKIFETINFLRRLLPIYKKPRHWFRRVHSRIRSQIAHFQEDQKLINELKEYDAIIFAECIPNAYWKNYFYFEGLRRKIPGIPIILYEVFFLDSAPHFIAQFIKEGDHTGERFDFNLAISDVSYTKAPVSKKNFTVGLDLKSFGLEPVEKEGLIALVDFEWEGFEDYRVEQIEVLKELGIEFISMEGEFSIEEIRQIYKRASIFFIQHFESFGLPIAECLAGGAYVFTPHSGWPMAFRLDEKPETFGEGKLPECFIVYKNKDDLREKLKTLKSKYDPVNSPQDVFNIFYDCYPHFYEGNLDNLRAVLKKIEDFKNA
jgi:hypothetical protein